MSVATGDAAAAPAQPATVADAAANSFAQPALELEEGQLDPALVAAGAIRSLDANAREFDEDDSGSEPPSPGAIQTHAIGTAKDDESDRSDDDEVDQLLRCSLDLAPATAAPSVSLSAAVPPLLHAQPAQSPDSSSPPTAALWSLPLPRRESIDSAKPDSGVRSAAQRLRARIGELEGQDALAAASTAVPPLPYAAVHTQTHLAPASAVSPAAVASSTAATPLVAPAASLPAVALPSCVICWDAISDASYTPPSCLHAVCAPCWNGYVLSRMDENMPLAIRCPSATPKPCPRVLEEQEVLLRLRSERDRERYTALAQLARLARDPNVRWCTTPGCQALHIPADAASTGFLQCDRCHAKVCVACGQRWHPDASCESASSAALLALLQANLDIKACPSCGEAMERSEGCNFTRCSRCQFEFCWLCLSAYSDSHFEWWNLRGCPLQHQRGLECIGSDTCCCLPCRCACAGACKRGLARATLFLCYAIGFAILLPFLLLASPYLTYRYCCLQSSRDARRHQKQVDAKNKQIAMVAATQRKAAAAKREIGTPAATAAENHAV